jgi:hypothetical protein
MGKPVLANGRCDVLRGQAMRSNAGLYYENYAEFVEAVRALEGGAGIAASLGRNGRRYFQAHYTWPIIEKKYLDMFAQLSREPAADRARRLMEPIPGWWRRRQRSLAPAREVLTGLPSGPVRPGAAPAARPSEERRPASNPEPHADRRPSAGDRQARPERERPDRPGRNRRDGHERSGSAEPRGGGRPESRDRQNRGERPRPAVGPSAPAAGGSAPAAARPGGRGRMRRGRTRRPDGKQGS